MDEDQLGEQEMGDAGRVRSVRRRMDEAIGELSERPFDEAAAARMRRALDATASARSALLRLRRHPPRPAPRGALRLVDGAPDRRVDEISERRWTAVGDDPPGDAA